ncbi:uncharacterized protein N7477_002048 [Penicillium maclennaniae]|uniref:uncharacterized protein n=1 Tax=Penicillium maclennaniae TaxID=1343394 RepID=UPI00253FE911|nr:uncharacterized protein N7477_002048 [Penicillium maclennaniae]KAJ5682108.1 hypothetical protein N7477_002048 [Penicillium maclennaniae]
MGSIKASDDASKFILTAEALNQALPQMHVSTRAIHADDFVSSHRAIAPGMHTAVNFRYARDPDNLVPEENKDASSLKIELPNAPYDSHVYSRYTAPNTNRLEVLLKNIMGGEVITYSTGLSSFHAMVVLLNPKKVFIGDGYHGCHGVLDIIHRLTGVQKLDLTDVDQAGPGDMIHVETPLNPTGEARNLAYYRAKATEKGAYLTVDATFAPPPLQNPLDFGADIVMHSGTKYVGGHSDMLCGILVIRPDHVEEGWLKTLHKDRQYIGSVMGSFEGWLGIRSVRTMQLRVARQAQTAERLAKWLHEQLQDPKSPVGKVLSHVKHASLQEDDLKDGWLRKQMPGGFGPVFSMWAKNPDHARRLPTRMFVFQHATSLGGRGEPDGMAYYERGRL